MLSSHRLSPGSWLWRRLSLIAIGWAGLAVTPTCQADEPPKPVVTEAIVNASLDDVWQAWSTNQGLESWMVAKARIDLKVGGKLLTHYDPQGQLGDGGTIENTILSYEPRRMLSIRATKPPEKFPFKDALREMWTVVLFEPIDRQQTRVRCVSQGFVDTDESRRMRTHFEAGNAWTLKKLQERFAKATDPRTEPAQGSAPADVSAADLAPIQAAVTVAASRADVWQAWTTNEGAQKFFAPKTNIELRVGGSFEILFAPDLPAGLRGAEGLKVLTYLPQEMLSFEWNAPPQFPKARPQKTWVVVRLEAVDSQPNQTQVHLTHLGFQERVSVYPEEREEWGQVRQYFVRAWPSVLANLKRRFAEIAP